MTGIEPEIVGREEELAVLAELTETPEALPRAIVLEGEAGIGKTTLWKAGVEAARPFYRVLSSRPAEPDSRISFAAMADLLEGVLDETLSELPGPQRYALEVALLRVDPQGLPPQQNAVAFAFLGCLQALARDAPVLVAVDDVQWLDAPSAVVLQYAARRLGEARVGLLIACRRDGDGEPPLGLARALGEDRLRILRVGPLSLGALGRMLYERLGSTFPRPTMRRIHDVSSGNPFYALELGRALQRQEAASGELPIPPTLDSLVAEGIESLTPPTRTLLLVASALAEPTVGQLEEAGLVDDTLGALDEALGAHVIERNGDRIRFTHPLVAAAIAAHAGETERRAVHKRLAELARTPEERGRHLALSASIPSAATAGAVHDGARDALSRGAPSAAAELLEHALRLTPFGDPAGAERRFELADALYTSGDAERARSILRELVDELPEGNERARVLWRLALIEGELAGSTVETELYERALGEAAGDDALTARIEVGLARMRTFGGAPEEGVEHAERALRLAQALDDRAVLAEALAVFVEANRYAGRDVPREQIERAVEIESELERPPSVSSPSSVYSLELRANLELDRARDVLERHLAQVTAYGNETAEPMVLFRLFDTELLAGRWERAEWCAARIRELAEPSGVSREYARLSQALVDAHFGRVDEARDAAAAGLAFAVEAREPPLEHHNRALLGFVSLSVGDATAAAEELLRWEVVVRELGFRDPFHLLRGALNEAEALVEAGRLDEAERVVDWFEEAGREAGRDWPGVLSARPRGLLLAASGELESALRSLERLPDGVPFERGRTLLARGIVLRRAKRRRDARKSLESARGAFEELGAALWIAKAEEELGRIGGRTPAGQELTPAEQRIAELVAEGKTNKEVAAELFVTVHTVEAALTRVYGKLGIRSRTELAHRLHPAPKV